MSDERRKITREELEALLDARPDVAVVEALPPGDYERGHLPGAINIPHDRIDEHAPTMLPEKGAEIVTYCANEPCQNSRIAARRLTHLVYTNVREYPGGKQDWIEAGLSVEEGTQRKTA